jgi:hypothetical protein
VGHSGALKEQSRLIKNEGASNVKTIINNKIPQQI